MKIELVAHMMTEYKWHFINEADFDDALGVLKQLDELIKRGIDAGANVRPSIWGLQLKSILRKLYKER